MIRASGLSIFKVKETQFFIDVITTTLRDRQANGESTRNDLIDMMLKAMKEETGEVDDNENKEQFDLDSELKNHQKSKKKELDETTIVATAMIMLIAGEYVVICLEQLQFICHFIINYLNLNTQYIVIYCFIFKTQVGQHLT